MHEAVQTLRTLFSVEPICPTKFPVAFSPDGSLLAAAGNAGQVNIWDLTKEPIADRRTIEFKSKSMKDIIVTALCFAPDSKSLIIGTLWLRAFDVNTTVEMAILYKKDIEISFGTSVLDFLNDPGHLAVATHSGVDLYDIRSGNVARLLHSSVVGRVSFFKYLPDNKHCILVGGLGDLVHICHVGNQVGVATISLASRDPFSLSVSADGKKLAIMDAAIGKTDAYQAWRKLNRHGETDNSVPVMISIWRINEGTPVFIGQINIGTEYVSAIAMSPDGETLVTVGQSLRFWDIGQVR